MDARRLRRRALTRVEFVAVLVCTAASSLGAGAYASTPPATSFDYLYIEANSGSSAGGHAAVRFGDVVYHFQHADPGIIRPAAQPWTTFDLSYRGLGNRPIHVQRVAVSPATYEHLRARFQRRFVVEESHVERLEAARRDRELLACLAESRQEKSAATCCGLNLQGAGYFYGAGPPRERLERRPAVDALRRRIEHVHGPAYLTRRIDELRTEIEELRPVLAPADLPRAGLTATSARGIAETHAELLLEYLALRVLAGEILPQRDAFRVAGPLKEHERDVLAARASHQAERLIDLLASSRSDRGYPLLIGAARLAALHASIERGELVVLDTYADDAPTLPASTLRQYDAAIGALAVDRRREMEAMRADAFAASARDEAAWSRFEVATNVALELEEALAGRRALLRWHQPSFGPAKGASLLWTWPMPELPEAIRAAALEHAEEQEGRIAARLRDLHRYDLVRRNCVTELFRTIHDDAGVELTDFGDRIEVGTNANFIPFVSAMAVSDAYAVVDEVVLPSYRELELRRLSARSPSWTTALREETSLTSTLIPFDPGAEVFLFFSDGNVAWRPLAGAANVAFAASAMLGGVVVSPFDGGSLLTASARGLFYSLPELAFVNIRKGSVALLPRDWSDPGVAPNR